MPRRPTLITTAGNPIGDNQNSITAGERGPVLMQDCQLNEKLAHQGRGARRTFTTTRDISKYTTAGAPQAGAKTPMIARFPTAARAPGVADAERDVCAFRTEVLH